MSLPDFCRQSISRLGKSRFNLNFKNLEVLVIPKSAAEKAFGVESTSFRFDPSHLSLQSKRG
jgi:hypothetical protein